MTYVTIKNRGDKFGEDNKVANKFYFEIPRLGQNMKAYCTNLYCIKGDSNEIDIFFYVFDKMFWDNLSEHRELTEQEFNVYYEEINKSLEYFLVKFYDPFEINK